MNDQLIISKIQQLHSTYLKQELLFFLDYLLTKQHADKKLIKKPPQFGCAKGTFKLAEDFDEPLEDFKNYMP
ncbi:MAG: DUF2281 domain-containing protein [Thioploca sp.]|nr:DUF2281 domain-containing protein [Thioploca sp.]